MDMVCAFPRERPAGAATAAVATVAVVPCCGAGIALTLDVRLAAAATAAVRFADRGIAPNECLMLSSGGGGLLESTRVVDGTLDRACCWVGNCAADADRA